MSLESIQKYTMQVRDPRGTYHPNAPHQAQTNPHPRPRPRPSPSPRPRPIPRPRPRPRPRPSPRPRPEQVSYRMAAISQLHGIALWFDCRFPGSQRQVFLSTAPHAPLTHWYQARRREG